MNRFSALFADLKNSGRKGLVGFLAAGDPDLAQSESDLRTALEHGVDILELGVPFSDPTADGPVVQQAAGRALAAAPGPPAQAAPGRLMAATAVVIPVKDGERWLAEVLDAVRREDPDELLVIDSGSSDGSAAIARDAISTAPPGGNGQIRRIGFDG